MAASDIDGTLCVSSTSAEGATRVRVVDCWSGGSAVTTELGHARWQQLARANKLVPVSARRIDQFTRMLWPGPVPRVAVLLNGSIVLKDGEEDRLWSDEVTRIGRRLGWNPAAAKACLGAVFPGSNVKDCQPGLFTQSMSCTRPSPRQRADLAAAASDNGWVASIQGRRAFLSPMGFGKLDAVRHLQSSHGVAVVAAAGDSALDIGMMRAAPLSACPQGSEAHAILGDSATHVVSGSAVTRVEGVADWLAAQVLAL